MPIIIEKQFFEAERYNGQPTGLPFTYSQPSQYFGSRLVSSCSSSSSSMISLGHIVSSSSSSIQPQDQAAKTDKGPPKSKLSRQERIQREVTGIGNDGLWDARFIEWPKDFDPLLLAAQHSHPMDQTVRLGEIGDDDHVYFTRWGFPFDMRERTTGQISVSKLKDNYFPVFDRVGFFARSEKTKDGKHTSAKYYGLTDAEVTKKWDEKRDLTSLTGKKVHRVIECYLNQMNIEAYRKFRVIQHFLKSYKEEIIDKGWIPFRTEWSMRSGIDLMITGQADALFVHKSQSPKDGKLKLRMLDWKFTDDLTTQGYNGQIGWGACSHLQDCKKSYYGIQLFAYKRILEAGYGNMEYMGHKYTKLEIGTMELWVVHDSYEGVYIVNIDQDNDSYSSAVDLIFSDRRKYVQQKKSENHPDFAF